MLVVECDLRRPRVNTALKIEPTPGLTNYLNDECSLEDIIKDTKIDNLKAIAYGAIPPNPSELLASEAMADLIKTAEKEYDYIIFDTPPVGIVIDAVPILKAADGVVIVARNNSTTYPELAKTVETVERTDAKSSELFLTELNRRKQEKARVTTQDMADITAVQPKTNL